MHQFCPPSCAGPKISPLMVVPLNRGCSSEKKHTKKRNPIPSLLAEVIACFELKIFTVRLQPPRYTQLRASKQCLRGRVWDRWQLALWWTIGLIPTSNYSATHMKLLYCRNFKPLSKLWIVTPCEDEPSIPCGFRHIPRS